MAEMWVYCMVVKLAGNLVGLMVESLVDELVENLVDELVENLVGLMVEKWEETLLFHRSLCKSLV